MCMKQSGFATCLVEESPSVFVSNSCSFVSSSSLTINRFSSFDLHGRAGHGLTTDHYSLYHLVTPPSHTTGRLIQGETGVVSDGQGGSDDHGGQPDAIGRSGRASLPAPSAWLSACLESSVRSAPSPRIDRPPPKSFPCAWCRSRWCSREPAPASAFWCWRRVPTAWSGRSTAQASLSISYVPRSPAWVLKASWFRNPMVKQLSGRL